MFIYKLLLFWNARQYAEIAPHTIESKKVLEEWSSSHEQAKNKNVRRKKQEMIEKIEVKTSDN